MSMILNVHAFGYSSFTLPADSRDFYIIVGVACSGAIAIAAALILAVLVVWIIKW